MSIESKLRVLRIAPLLIVGLALHAHGSRAAEPSATTVIINAQLADGTGAALRQANVRIAGDRIERVGSFEPGRDEQVIDAKGLVLAIGDTGLIPLHFQISLWATRDGITYTPRVDEQTLAWKFVPKK